MRERDKSCSGAEGTGTVVRGQKFSDRISGTAPPVEPNGTLSLCAGRHPRQHQVSATDTTCSIFWQTLDPSGSTPNGEPSGHRDRESPSGAHAPSIGCALRLTAGKPSCEYFILASRPRDWEPPTSNGYTSSTRDAEPAPRSEQPSTFAVIHRFALSDAPTADLQATDLRRNARCPRAGTPRSSALSNERSLETRLRHRGSPRVSSRRLAKSAATRIKLRSVDLRSELLAAIDRSLPSGSYQPTRLQPPTTSATATLPHESEAHYA